MLRESNCPVPTGYDDTVLKEYPYTVLRVEQQGRIWRVETDRGPKALYSYSGNTGKVNRVHQTLEHLAGRGFRHLNRYIRTRDGKPFVLQANNAYVLTDWLPGRKADFCRAEEVLLATKALAEIHRLGTGACTLTVPGDTYDEKYWHNTLVNRCNEYHQYRQIVEKRSLRTTFDNLFLIHATDYENGALEALKKVAAGCRQLTPGGYQGQVCHRDWREENLLIAGRRLSIIGWEHCGTDFPVTDLSRFIRRVMVKKGDWDGATGVAVIAGYDHIRPLEIAEKEVLHGLLSFPERFWDSVASYYRGSVSAATALHQLQQAIGEEQRRQTFIQTVAGYLQG
ncbi:MAG: CotS family spore coat protein [Heliobacteriaceae bacterium]|nr:CotS family spore coat protein [Heliobacteriaceae bacterium]MDD4587310.1 CotS family spore coat protein [Heliobacteriaceae bacterium]